MQIWISAAVLLSSLLYSSASCESFKDLSRNFSKQQQVAFFVDIQGLPNISYNADLNLKPASLMKLVSTAALLKIIPEQDHLNLNSDLTAILSSSDNNQVAKLFDKYAVKDAPQVISEYVKDLGYQADIHDTSGKSHENRLNCNTLIAILKLYKGQTVFTSTLARPGIGTLKDRKKLPASLIAKTGSIRGVRGLAGYIITKNNTEVLFCMINNEVKSDPQAIQFEDSFVQSIWNDL